METQSLGRDDTVLNNKNSFLVLKGSFQTFCVLGLFALAACVHADDNGDHHADDEKTLSLNGFATFAVSKPLTDDDEYSIHDFLREDDDLDFRNHNVLGLRLTAELDDKLSLTAQMVSKGINDYEAQFDWIYAEYALTQQWHIAVGRIRTPLFMYSEFIDVGYAYQWVQAPGEVYNLVDYPFQTMESVRLRYNTTWRGWDTELVGWVGSTSDELKTNGFETTLELKEAWGLSFSSSHSWFTLRGVYFTGLTSADLSSISLFGQPNPFMPFTNSISGDAQSYLDELAELDKQTSQDISKDIVWEDDRGEYASIGSALNFEHIFVNAEITYATVDSTFVAPTVLAGYAMLGYQINPSWSVSYTLGHSKTKVNTNSWDNIRIPSNASPQLTQELLTFQAVTKASSQNIQEAKSHSNTINIRYDFHPKAALKAEYWQKTQYVSFTGKHPKGVRLSLDLAF